LALGKKHEDETKELIEKEQQKYQQEIDALKEKVEHWKKLAEVIYSVSF
jgi:hypothetical protein